MPTKRRFIIFLIVLALMLLIKRAVGQEVVGWDPQSCWDCGGLSLEAQVTETMLGGLIIGTVIGAYRVFERSTAAAQGRYFTGDLVVLRIR